MSYFAIMLPILSQQAERNCAYCGESIRGRSDKKFCNSECRNGYHNHHAANDDAFMREVNKALRKNRKILRELTPEGKATVPLARLEDRGFNFKYFTHTYRTQKGSVYTYCYEFGYLEFKPNIFLLVKREQK